MARRQDAGRRIARAPHNKKTETMDGSDRATWRLTVAVVKAVASRRGEGSGAAEPCVFAQPRADTQVCPYNGYPSGER